MTFGLRNAAQTFQRFIDEVTRDLPFIFVYIDDILVASENEHEHLEHLELLFQRLQSYGLVINLTKSYLGKSDVQFLGHTVNSAGIVPLTDKVKAILSIEFPTTIKNLRRFLGTINFYRKFIKNAAEILAPLNSLLEGSNVKNSQKVNWTIELKTAFDNAKEALAQSTLLAHPDTNAQWAIFTDASDYGIGAVLQQCVRQNWQPLAFYSRKLPPAIRKLSTYDRELHAIFEAVKHFRHIFEGRHVIIYTDHKPLQHAFQQRTERASPWQFRRLDYIGQFTSDIRHISGHHNIVADTLSRIEAIQAAVSAQELSTAQHSDVELQQLIRNPTTGLKLQKIQTDDNEQALYCDITTGTARPYVPVLLRKQVFDSLHSLAHPGIKSSQKLVSKSYVWPSVNRDCRRWAKSCVECQRNKIQRHVYTPVANFQPSQRFEHIHIDLVTLPSSRGFNQCCTIIDRFTRFPEAIPLENGTAETVARALIANWIARYGVPRRITSDQGRQFVSNLFRSLSQILGVKHLRTSPYHPQSNGLVERLHRQLKSALLCHRETWVDALPVVLLGLRAAWKEDIGATPAELVYGEQIRLPGEFIAPSNKQVTASELLLTLKNHFKNLAPTESSRHGKKPLFYFKNLNTCSHVLVRNDHIEISFSSPYEGPYKVIARHNKYFIVDYRGKRTAISIDRLKPVYMADDSPDEQELRIETMTSSHRTAIAKLKKKSNKF